MRIFNTQVYGFEESIIRSGYPMLTEIPEDIVKEICEMEFDEDDNELDIADSTHFKRACKLGNTPGGSGHDKFLRGIRVQADIIAPRYFWQEWDTYHFNESISSQSTMHCITKFNIDQMVNQYVHPAILAVLKVAIKEYNENPSIENFLRVKSNIPEGLEVGRGIDTNYASIKTMYQQRETHRLPEWSVEFANWVNTLPYVKELGIIRG